MGYPAQEGKKKKKKLVVGGEKNVKIKKTKNIFSIKPPRLPSLVKKTKKNVW